MVMQFFERLRKGSSVEEDKQTVLTLKPTPEEVAAEAAASLEAIEDYWKRKEQQENEALQKRIELLKEIDAVVRPMLLEINSQKFNDLGKITVRPEITEVQVPKDVFEAVFDEYAIKKMITYYALEWRTQETGLNGFCITIRIMDEDLEQQDPLFTLNTRDFFIGYLVTNFKKKDWAEKLKKSIVKAIETGQTNDWLGVPEEKSEVKTDPVPALGYEPIEEVEGEALEEEYPFPEGCQKCGRPFGAKLLKEAYNKHEAVIECPGCSTPVHRRKHKSD